MLEFQKSRFCSGGDCVEVGQLGDGRIVLRDTDNRVVVYSSEEWSAFIKGAKAGQFDFQT